MLAKLLWYPFPSFFATLTGEYAVSNAVVGVAFTALLLADAALQLLTGVFLAAVGLLAVVAILVRP